VDLDHLIEEVESLGISLRRELQHRLRVLLTHLLKWDKQPEHRSRSWSATILHQQEEIRDLLEESPSLTPLLPGLLTKVYTRAVKEAVKETGIYPSLFLIQCPWTVDEVLEETAADTEEETI
jgi:hypothetical protein